MLDHVATVRRAYAHAAAALSSYRDRDLHDELEGDGGPPLTDEDRAVLDNVLDDLQAYLDHMADPANRPPALRPATSGLLGAGPLDAPGLMQHGYSVFQNSAPAGENSVHFVPVPLEPGMVIRYRW